MTKKYYDIPLFMRVKKGSYSVTFASSVKF